MNQEKQTQSFKDWELNYFTECHMYHRHEEKKFNAADVRFHPLITHEKKLTGDQSFLWALTVSQVSSLDSEYTHICCVVQLLVSGQTQPGEFVPL